MRKECILLSGLEYLTLLTLSSILALGVASIFQDKDDNDKKGGEDKTKIKDDNKK